MPNVNNKKLVVILGPTASGKTKLSLRLAKKLHSYIISADSRQVYKEMNIGTAKPIGSIKYKVSNIKGDEKKYYIDDIPHYLIDIINPDQEFTLADWQKSTNDILSRGHGTNSDLSIPFIVGGTGLYISSIINNYQLPTGKTDQELRNKLQKLNIEELLPKLEKLDPITYQKIDQKNKLKIVRALEYTMTNNRSFYQNTKKQPSPYNILQIGIDIPRAKLYGRINNRVDKMMTEGLVEETKKLLKKYSLESPSMSGIGYQEIIQYLNQELTLEQATDKIKQHTRNYAKRQMTWFKKDSRIKWVKNYSEAEKLVGKFIR